MKFVVVAIVLTATIASVRSATVATNSQYIACRNAPSACQSLTMQSSGLSGSMPTEIGTLTRLTHLLVFNNQLIGSLPSQLGRLVALTQLDLSDNQLSGSIPSQLGQLTKLNSLWLNKNNRLVGSLPTQIDQLTALTTFKVETTSLCGPARGRNMSPTSLPACPPPPPSSPPLPPPSPTPLKLPSDAALREYAASKSSRSTAAAEESIAAAAAAGKKVESEMQADANEDAVMGATLAGVSFALAICSGCLCKTYRKHNSCTQGGTPTSRPAPTLTSVTV